MSYMLYFIFFFIFATNLLECMYTISTTKFDKIYQPEKNLQNQYEDTMQGRNTEDKENCLDSVQSKGWDTASKAVLGLIK